VTRRARLRLRTVVCIVLLIPAATVQCSRLFEPAVQPSFVIVTLDTTRADRFAAYGGEPEIAPNVNRWAEEATVFEQCVSPSGVTVPSHATIFTGLYPRRHSVLTNGHRLKWSFETLAERLRRAGYETAAYVALPGLMKWSGLRQGFRHYFEYWRVRDAEQTHQAAAEWLDTRSETPETPFFLWVHYFDVHSPYEETEWSKPRLEGYDGDYGDDVSIATFGTGAWMERAEDVEAVRTLYDGQLHSTDQWFGRLLGILDEVGLRDRTVVVLTADHGQALGEHQHPGHGALWHSILSVPLIIQDGRDPDGQRVSTRVGLVDLMPTLLEMAGVDAPDDLDGRSLGPALRGGSLDEAPYFATSPTDDPEATLAYRGASYVGPFKIVADGEESVAFDLASDPGELSPLVPERRPPDFDALVEQAASHGLEADALGRAPIDDDIREQLRALGYSE
jgi:choline-sulfatase